MYDNIAGGDVVHQLRLPCFTRPVNELRSWDERQAAFNAHSDFFHDYNHDADWDENEHVCYDEFIPFA